MLSGELSYMRIGLVVRFIYINFYYLQKLECGSMEEAVSPSPECS